MKGADKLLLDLYRIHIKDKLTIPTQKNTTIKEEIKICDDDEELDEDDLNNCFTLTQSKIENDELIFTECANESRVGKYNYNIFYAR